MALALLIVPLSLDKDWLSPAFPVVRGGQDLKPFRLNRNYLDFADHARSRQFSRLLDLLMQVS